MLYRTLWWLIVAVLLLPACGTTDTIRTRNRARLDQLREGMTRDEVLAVMGTGPATLTTEQPPYVETLVDNPYRTAIFRSENATWEVLFYLTELQLLDNTITEDELTPIVLRNGVLTGWGWIYWNEQVREHDIR